MKKIFKYLLVSLLFIAATVTAHAFGMTDNSGMALAVTPVAAPLLNQQAEKELIKQFRHENTWLSELRSKNNWVNADVIKIPKRGAAPTVLINNNVYPISSNNREDSYVTLSLNKYDTENTTVTDDELYALPYEKVSDVQMQHREELEDVTAEHALHSLAPSLDTATTPVIECTGTAVNGRPTLTSKDIVTLKGKLDKLNVKRAGRILVLCSEHVSDLLNEDRVFYQQYHNAKDGTLSTNYYGFKIYESTYTPTYVEDAGNGNANTKTAFGAVAGAKVASICFHKDWAVKATGSVKRYLRDAAQDPEMRENTLGFRLWFIGLAIRDEGVGAIIG
mgnify:CR=1 FL=1